MLSLHVFQHNHRNLTAGERFEQFLRLALRSLKNRKWPPPPLHPKKIGEVLRSRQNSGGVYDPDEVMRAHEARCKELFDPKRIWRYYLENERRSPFMDFIIKNYLFPGSDKPRNVRRRAKRSQQRVIRELCRQSP